MSWSVSATGRSAKVAESIVADSKRATCPEPEETAKHAVVGVVASLLSAFPSNAVVSVTASGSQYTPNGEKPDEKLNSLNVELKTIAFVD